MRGTQATTAEAPALLLDPEELDRVAGALADQFTLLYDAEPADAHVACAGNTLVFSFQGGLTSADLRLLEAGQPDRLKAFRERFLAAVEDRMTEIVTALTAMHVLSFVSIFHPDSRTTKVVFVLDPSSTGDRESRQALLNWSVQVRRSARALRATNLATRDRHLELKQQLHELREAMGARRN